MSGSVQIRALGNNEAVPYDLLLEADPSREAVHAYIRAPGAQIFVLPAPDPSAPLQGVLVLLPLGNGRLEIKNIAVSEELRGGGIGRRLLEFSRNYARENEYRFLLIGTGNSSLEQLRLYQKAGFRMKEILRDFFVRNYPEPLFENGLQCRDMVLLEQELE